MEPISEERQRKVYEWWKPELKDKRWEIATSYSNVRCFTWPIEGQEFNHWEPSPALYVKDRDGNWQPNYQWFFTEAVSKLTTERVRVFCNLMGCPEWCLDPERDEVNVFVNADPIAALAEYVEVSGEA